MKRAELPVEVTGLLAVPQDSQNAQKAIVNSQKEIQKTVALKTQPVKEDQGKNEKDTATINLEELIY